MTPFDRKGIATNMRKNYNSQEFPRTENQTQENFTDKQEVSTRSERAVPWRLLLLRTKWRSCECVRL